MFINIVRANLFRLRRSPTFWICLVCCVLVPLAPQLLAYLVHIANGTLGDFTIVVAPNSRGFYGICALFSSIIIADLLSSEHGATRSFICAGYRRAHTYAALATLFLISLASVSLVMAEGIFFSAATGVSIEEASVAAWCYGFAGSVFYTTAVASLSLMMAATIPVKTISMCFATLMGLSLPGGSVAWVMDLLANMFPTAAGLCTLIVQIQLSSVATALENPAMFLGNATSALYPFAVSAGWVGASGLLVTTVWRRATLG